MAFEEWISKIRIEFILFYDLLFNYIPQVTDNKGKSSFSDSLHFLRSLSINKESRKIIFER